MIIRTLGNNENPVIIMIPGMFCTYEMPGIIAEYLKDDFCILLPTLDGHHKEEPIYHSKQEVASKIDIPVDRFLFDGGPFFHFPGFYRAFMAKKFMSFMKTTKGKPKEQAIDALMNDPFIKKQSYERFAAVSFAHVLGIRSSDHLLGDCDRDELTRILTSVLD